MSNFKELALNINILNALEQKGYFEPTPIQAQAIPHILLGKDFLGIAQTGTGKTAAFSLPILHLLSEKKSGDGKNPRALILTPTRELASQIVDNVEFYGKELRLTYAVIFGGVSDVEQIKTIKRGVDIIVATPGRLIDLLQQRALNLQNIEIFVLDEADRMLDMGFIVDVKRIVKQLPKQRQNLFFSATMPQAINKLSHEILHQPVIAEITPQSTTVERITQKVFLVENSNKRMLLKEILQENDLKTVLVFCKTKRGANQLASFLLGNRVNSSLIHGNKSQSAREKALQDFRDGKVKVLIATDIASRGIDIVGISHVINYDMPLDPESYVHRIGRTARAGREGIAISFCDTLELKFLREIERTIGKKIPIDDSRMFKESSSMSRKIGEKKLNNNKQEQTMINNSNNKSQNNGSFVGRKISSAKTNPQLQSNASDLASPNNFKNTNHKKAPIEEIQQVVEVDGFNAIDKINSDKINSAIDVQDDEQKNEFNHEEKRMRNNNHRNQGRRNESHSLRSETETDESPVNHRHHANKEHRPHDNAKKEHHRSEGKTSLVGNFIKKIKKILAVGSDSETPAVRNEARGDKRDFSERRDRNRNRNPNGNSGNSRRPQSSSRPRNHQRNHKG